MKTISLVAAILVGSVTAHAQGQFTFSTKSSLSGNDIRFQNFGEFISGPDWFVVVYAGTAFDHLLPIPGAVLPLNAAGNLVGYTNPFSRTFIVPGFTGQVAIGYQVYHGTS